MTISFASLELLLDASGATWGYADVNGVFPAFPDYTRAVSIAWPLPTSALVGLEQGPTKAYYGAYQEANALLNEISGKAAALLERMGYRSLASPATVSQQQLRDDLGPEHTARLAHKTVATRAGLGWIGKNALLITRQYGPRVRLASVLTQAPLSPALPVTETRCGKCRLCVDACPASALLGGSWTVGMSRDNLVNVQRCADAAHTLLLSRTGQDDTVCGICIAVCPFGKAKGSPTG